MIDPETKALTDILGAEVAAEAVHEAAAVARADARSKPADAEAVDTTVAFLVANEGVEQVELTEPWHAVEEAGCRPRLVAPSADDVQAFDHLDRADRFRVDVTVADADLDAFAMLVLPGGVANPDQLRLDPAAVDLVRRFVDAGKPVAAICHAPWTLVEADRVRDRRLTSWPSLATDIRNAGGTWVDEELVVDDAGPGPLLTSRKPDDLKAFCQAIVDRLARARTA